MNSGIKKGLSDMKHNAIFKPKAGYVYVVTNECLKLVKRKASLGARWLRP